LQVAIKPLVTALDMVGRKNLILDFPESLTDQLNLVKLGAGETVTDCAEHTQ
jgi:hypothetical protein